jgi:integrase
MAPGAIDLWFNQNKGGADGDTHKGHDRVWAEYESWLNNRGGRPYNFDVTDIANYLSAVMMPMGRSQANKFLATCSVTRQAWLPTASPLSEHPTIKALRKGVDKSLGRANVKSKQPVFFSLRKLFDHVADMSTDDTKCKLATLRDKLIILMLIDGMARASDILSVTRDAIAFNESHVQFFYYNTKEMKAPAEKAAVIAAYREDRRICTVTVLKHYIDRTKNCTIEPVYHTLDGKKIRRSPLFIATQRIQKGTDVYARIGKERISNTATAALRAIGDTHHTTHAIRGAAGAKCVNLQPPRRPEVCIRGRWASDKIYNEYYHRVCHYKEANDPRFSGWTLEQLMRFRATRVGF